MGWLLVAASLAGCSALKLGYNTLPDLAYWWLDGYADFTDEQAPRVRDELARLQAWHRANELPKIADMLERMERLAPGPVSPEQACAFVQEAQARLVAIAHHGAPAATAFIPAFSARQLRHIERRFEKKNAEWRAEWIEPPASERQEKRFKQWADRLETLYGPLDDAQREVLRRAVARTTWDPQRQLAEWQRRQADLLGVVREIQASAGDPVKGPALLHAFVARGLRSPDAAYRHYQHALLEENCRTFAAVHESTSAEQRARAARRLKAWQRDLRELASAP